MKEAVALGINAGIDMIMDPYDPEVCKDIIASKVPDVKRLRQFTKVELNPGESKIVRLEIPAHELAFVGHDGKWRLEKGQFRIACGSESMMIDCTETKVWDTPNID